MERVYYDGSCGFCHRAVRFILAKDRAGVFRFAPLGGESFKAAVPEAVRAGLPDSLIVLTADGRLLVRSAAVRHVLGRLGGLWAILAAVARVVPSVVLDRLYDWIARIRYRIFPRPSEACPVLPGHLRARFDP